MFSGFMVNAWVVGTIVAVVAGVVGFFVVLRGSAFPAHAIPNGAFAGAAGASLLGVSTLLGPRRVRPARRRSGSARSGRRGRHDVATALALVMMLALGRAVPEPEHRVRAGDLLAALRRGPRRQHAPRSCPSLVLGVVCIAAVVAALPAAHAFLGRARDRRGPGRRCPPHRDGLPLVSPRATTMTVPVVGALLIFSLMIGPAGGGPRFTTAGPASLLSVGAGPGTVWSAIACSYQSQLAGRLLRRHLQCGLLRGQPGLGRACVRWQGIRPTARQRSAPEEQGVVGAPA